MAFRALLFSKSPETSTAMTAACESAGIRLEVCSDIFTAIEKVKTRAFSCLIPDWNDQPESSFLLKRARESTPNREAVGVAIVDNEPTASEMRDNRLEFLIYRPISVEEADAVLAKACEQMRPLSAQDAADSAAQPESAVQGSHSAENASSQSHEAQTEGSGETSAAEVDENYEITAGENDAAHGRISYLLGPRTVVAAVITLAAVVTVWRARETIVYLAHTPEGVSHVLKESVASLFYMNQSGAMPVSSAGSDAQQDAYFSRSPVNSAPQSAHLGVAATESTLPETRIPLPKAFDFPLPMPVYDAPVTPPVHQEHAAVIPDSMRNSPPIAPPVVVTVNPAQMMPVSSPVRAPEMQTTSEPVVLTEQSARARLVHTVDPVYPSEGLNQKLQGSVVLQALIARDGSVEDLKIVRGYFILGRAAIAAVKQWRFQPYTLNGHAASTQTVITVNFSYPPG
jgi:TonB family protein